MSQTPWVTQVDDWQQINIQSSRVTSCRNLAVYVRVWTFFCKILDLVCMSSNQPIAPSLMNNKWWFV